ncbi:MAG: flagellar biosynthesis protein FliQ [Acidimicrobiales bacterium]
MNDSQALHLLGRAVLVSAELLMPVLLVSLIIGIVVSILQAVTQIQEMTLTFAPKLAGIALVLLLMGPWMVRELTDFTREMYELIPSLVN